MTRKDHAREETTRLEVFARFFKRYMSVSAFVTAALPIPVTAIGLISTYSFQTKILATYTSLFCFLVLAFIFYSRHKLARLLFPEFYDGGKTRRLTSAAARVLPLLLILGSLSCVFAYQWLLSASVADKRTKEELAAKVPDSNVLEKSHESETPEAGLLMMLYLGIFVTAEAAFVLMAIKEYLQDLLEFSDFDLITGRRPAAQRKRAGSPGGEEDRPPPRRA